MKITYVLIDFENVQPKDLALLDKGSYKIKIFLGAHQAKIPVVIASALQAFGSDVEYIQGSGGGKNAIDFHIAYYIGFIAATVKDAHFHVISKDAGFDPLIGHLNTVGVRCDRSVSIAAIPVIQHANSSQSSVENQVNAVVGNLEKRTSGKPRTLRTLRTTIKALFKQLSDADIDVVVEKLTRRNVLKITDGKVQYEPAL